MQTGKLKIDRHVGVKHLNAENSHGINYLMSWLTEMKDKRATNFYLDVSKGSVFDEPDKIEFFAYYSEEETDQEYVDRIKEADNIQQQFKAITEQREKSEYERLKLKYG